MSRAAAILGFLRRTADEDSRRTAARLLVVVTLSHFERPPARQAWSLVPDKLAISMASGATECPLRAGIRVNGRHHLKPGIGSM